MSRIVRESTCELTANAMRDGMLALMMPVMTSTDGRCVATTRWMPVARANCAMRQIVVSTFAGAIIMRSANSSMRMTTYGNFSSGYFALYSSILRTPALAKRS